jgi:hypothetical protein
MNKNEYSKDNSLDKKTEKHVYDSFAIKIE